MERYSNLRDAVLALDPVLIRTLAAFSIERHEEGLVVLFRFAFYGPRLDEPHNVEQYPVLSRAKPGDLLSSLPLECPETGSSMHDIFERHERNSRT